MGLIRPEGAQDDSWGISGAQGLCSRSSARTVYDFEIGRLGGVPTLAIFATPSAHPAGRGRWAIRGWRADLAFGVEHGNNDKSAIKKDKGGPRQG